VRRATLFCLLLLPGCFRGGFDSRTRDDLRVQADVADLVRGERAADTSPSDSLPTYQNVTTLAGDGTAGLVNGPVGTARFYYPHSVVVLPSGVLYITDRQNHVVRVIAGGDVQTLAGTGVAGFADGPAALAQFNCPTGLAVDEAGTIYVADAGNHRIRKIAKSDVTTLAGSTAGFANGQGASALFNEPHGLDVDASGRIYVADRYNNLIRLIVDGQVTTFAGTGVSGTNDGPVATAQLTDPIELALSPDGALYVGECKGRIRKIAGGWVSTVVGAAGPGFRDGPLDTAQLADPHGLALRGSGLVYVADQHNHAIRLIAGDQMVTLAGNGTPGFMDGPLASAQLSYPVGLDVDAAGVIYVADATNNRIRAITP
jgi:sugar lactone lactonase YvrE